MPQAAELRSKLIEAGARFSVVKNTLTERAADEAGAETLKEFLEGPTAFTFVSPTATWRWPRRRSRSSAARTTCSSSRAGSMGGEPLTIEQIESIAKLPALDVLHGQMVGVLASPITGLVRGLNALIAGLAIALGQIQAEGKAWRARERQPPSRRPERRGGAAAGGGTGRGDAGREAPATRSPRPKLRTEEASDEEAPSEGEEKEG